MERVTGLLGRVIPRCVPRRSGLIIVAEGADASGKTRVIEALQAAYGGLARTWQFPTAAFREREHADLTAAFIEDRWRTVAQIQKWVADGGIALLHRSMLSGLVYAHARGDWRPELLERDTWVLWPDVILYCDYAGARAPDALEATSAGTSQRAAIRRMWAALMDWLDTRFGSARAVDVAGILRVIEAKHGFRPKEDAARAVLDVSQGDRAV